jgi:two-component system, OmpR family, phosphate regulon sensor histidine kinase PhoR
MPSYRKKLLISQISLLLIFLVILYPLVEKAVQNVVRRSLEERTEDLIGKITNAKTVEEMVDNLKKQELLVFFRIGLITDKGVVLYDSHVKRILGEQFTEHHIVEHPEFREALQKGVGYSEGYSKIFSQTFAYVAISFEFLGKKYVIRTAFPLKQVDDLTRDFKIGFLTFAIAILILFSVMILFILNRLSRPIHHILNSIKNYKEGVLPKINLSDVIDAQDDFGKLALTLNSLSDKIEDQINKLIAQKNENESILDSLMEGVIAINENDLITYANHMASKILMAPKNNIISHYLINFKNKHLYLIDTCEKIAKECQKKEEIIIERFMKNDLSKIILDIIAIPKTHKKGAVLVFQDKTSDYKIVEMGKDFIANASHELRTPITVIKGFAETLQDLPDISKEMMATITEKIVKTCNRLDSLVKSLLTLTDIENISPEKFEKIDLGIMIENCLYYIQDSYEDVVINFEKKTKIDPIGGDYHLMELAILNILENSVKYANKAPRINITLSQWAGEIELKIYDNGIGIPEADLAYIFERFYTVDKARSRRFGGAGLGLSIVKTIIEKHQGKVTATSKLDEGSCFTILLPNYASLSS